MYTYVYVYVYYFNLFHTCSLRRLPPVHSVDLDGGFRRSPYHITAQSRITGSAKWLHPRQSSARLYFTSYLLVEEEICQGWLCPKICFLPSQGRCHSIAAWQRIWGDSTFYSLNILKHWCVKRSIGIADSSAQFTSRGRCVLKRQRPTSMIYIMMFLWRSSFGDHSCPWEGESCKSFMIPGRRLRPS